MQAKNVVAARTSQKRKNLDFILASPLEEIKASSEREDIIHGAPSLSRKLFQENAFSGECFKKDTLTLWKIFSIVMSKLVV